MVNLVFRLNQQMAAEKPNSIIFLLVIVCGLITGEFIIITQCKRVCLGIITFFSYVFLCFAKGKIDEVSKQPTLIYRRNRKDRLLLRHKYNSTDSTFNVITE